MFMIMLRSFKTLRHPNLYYLFDKKNENENSDNKIIDEKNNKIKELGLPFVIIYF